VPHTIRLQGPWQCESLAGGLVRYSRSFHRPTGLGPGHRTWLTIRGVDEIAQVQLNDCPLIAEEEAGELRRFEITDRLSPRNVVSIDVLANCQPQVALAIEEPT
jgi:hypothetical protein